MLIDAIIFYRVVEACKNAKPASHDDLFKEFRRAGIDTHLVELEGVSSRDVNATLLRLREILRSQEKLPIKLIEASLIDEKFSEGEQDSNVVISMLSKKAIVSCAAKL